MAKQTKETKLISRTSIYLSKPKQKEEEKKQPPRKHRLPSAKDNLTKMKTINIKTILSIIISIISLIGFIIVFALVIKGHNFKIDEFNVFLAGKRKDFATVLVKILTYFGSSILLFAASILALIFIKNKNVGVGLLGGLTIASLFNLVIKYTVRRPRPELMIVKETGFSFPSAHAMLSLVFFGLIIYFVIKYTDKKWLKILTTCILTLIIAVVGLTRIYLGVHFTSDILAGYLLGVPVLMLCVLILNRVQINIKKQKSKN